LQALVVDRARAGGLRLLGPNTRVAEHAGEFLGTFTSTLENRLARDRLDRHRQPIGRIWGAYAGGCDGAGLGISAFVTTGNEADITTADAID
jgi:acyl-CoA synthetase (NDP forming)